MNELIKLTHNPEALLALNWYLDKRIDDYKEALTLAQGDEVVKMQAKISELRHLKKIQQFGKVERRNG